MKNSLKLMVLLALGIFTGTQAADIEEKKITIVFPELLHQCADIQYSCEFYSQDPDGTLFLWVKIDKEDPYVILPNRILEFRGKDYVVTDVQTFGQEDIADLALTSDAICISIIIKPYE